jgi:hypothetical protein
MKDERRMTLVEAALSATSNSELRTRQHLRLEGELLQRENGVCTVKVASRNENG